MKNAIASVLYAGLMLIGVQALADDAMGSGSMSYKHMLKDCMARKMADDTTKSMTHDQMKSSCKDEMKMNKDSMSKDSMSKGNMGHDSMSK